MAKPNDARTPLDIIIAARALVATGVHPLTAIMDTSNKIALPLVILRHALDEPIIPWCTTTADDQAARVAAFDRAIALEGDAAK